MKSPNEMHCHKYVFIANGLIMAQFSTSEALSLLNEAQSLLVNAAPNKTTCFSLFHLLSSFSLRVLGFVCKEILFYFFLVCVTFIFWCEGQSCLCRLLNVWTFVIKKKRDSSENKCIVIHPDLYFCFNKLTSNIDWLRGGNCFPSFCFLTSAVFQGCC